MFSILPAVFGSPRIPLLRTLHRAATLTALVTLVTSNAACSKESTSPRGARLVYGASQALGQGAARAYVALDNAGQVNSVGVAISEAAMSTLPPNPMPGMPSAAMLSLALPGEGAVTGYKHVMLDWNPAGHEPEHVYTHPHFDLHFFQITPAERDAMTPANPEFAAKSAIFPAPEFVPAGFAAMSVLANIPAEAAAVPLMGMHWLDTSSPELQPPPNNQMFTRTFLYGSYDGRFIYVEPMITKAFIESAKEQPLGFSFQVSVPTKVATAGAYPSKYSVSYNAAAREYRISLDELVKKVATP